MAMTRSECLAILGERYLLAKPVKRIVVRAEIIPESLRQPLLKVVPPDPMKSHLRTFAQRRGR